MKNFTIVSAALLSLVAVTRDAKPVEASGPYFHPGEYLLGAGSAELGSDNDCSPVGYPSGVCASTSLSFTTTGHRVIVEYYNYQYPQHIDIDAWGGIGLGALSDFGFDDFDYAVNGNGSPDADGNIVAVTTELAAGSHTLQFIEASYTGGNTFTGFVTIEELP